MNESHIQTRCHDGVLDIVLNRPEQRNLLSAVMAQQIIAALQPLPQSVRLVRLSAIGLDFCVGRESPIPTLGDRPTGEMLRKVVTAPPLALYDAIKAAPVPVVAVVRGLASGVGCALACAADLTLCSTDARFEVPELERDIPPTLVMSALIGRVPLKSVAYLVLTRSAYDAQAALAAGLITQVVAPMELEEEVRVLSERILQCSEVSLRAVKQFLQLAPEIPQHAASGLAAHLGATALSARFASS